MTPLDRETIEVTIRKLEVALLKSVDNVCADTSLTTEINRILSSIDLSEVDAYLRSNLKHSYKLLATKHTKFALLSLYSICVNNYDKVLIDRLLKVLSRIYYNVLLNKYLKYCNDIIMHKAFQSVKGTNLFKKYGRQKALDLLSTSVANKIKTNTKCELLFFIKKIYELRHRIAQSLKSVVAMYYKLYREERSGTGTVSYDRLIDSIVQKIVFYGQVSIPERCTMFHNNINNLVNIDEDLLSKSLAEIFNLFGTNPTHQKILKNLHKLQYTKLVLKELGLPLTTETLYCYVSTIYRTMTS